MLQLVVALFGVFLSVSWVVLDERERTSHYVLTKGDVAAINFLSYRQAVVNYRIQNPTATGTIADDSLTWQVGFIRDTRWTNVISDDELYVYSKAAATPAVLQAAYAKSGRNIMIGKKDAAGMLNTASGSIIQADLPASIPVGAIVFVGG